MSVAQKASVAVSVVLAVCGSACGQWSADPSVNLPVADAAGDQVQPKVRLASDGSAYVSWFDNRTGGYDVYLQRLNAEGVEQWTHNGILVADRSVSSTEDYGLAVDAADNAVLVYGLVNFSSMGAQKISPAGAPLWGGGLAFSTPGGSHSPRVAAASDGHYVLGWTEGATIVLQRLDAGGAPQWGAGVVIVDPPNPTSRPILLSDIQPADNGSVIVLWVRCAGSNCVTSNKHLHCQKFDAAGMPLWNGGAPVVIFDATSIQNGTFPSFVADSGGGAVFGWYEVGGDRNAYVQHVSAAGAELFPHNGVATTGGTPGRIRISASVAYDPAADEIFCAWTEATSPTQNMWGVRAQKVSSAGTRQWTDDGAQVLALNGNQSSFVRVHAYGGGCVVHFLDARSATTGVVSSARLDAGGGLVWPASPIPASSRDTGKSRLDIAADSCGMARLVWADGASGGGQDLLAQNVRRDGTLGPVILMPGDLNCDGVVNAADVGPFVRALLDPPAYLAQQPCCVIANADTNGDTQIDGADVEGLSAMLIP